MHAVSILLVLMHLYWFCYGFFIDRGWTMTLLNRILGGFERTVGLFSHPLYTKLFAVLLLALSCLGTKGVKNEKVTWSKILLVLGMGFILFLVRLFLCKNVCQNYKYVIIKYVAFTSLNFIYNATYFYLLK
ncbi:YWFCY domain-containing protein [Sphingobacterium sp. MYb382]